MLGDSSCLETFGIEAGGAIVLREKTDLSTEEIFPEHLTTQTHFLAAESLGTIVPASASYCYDDLVGFSRYAFHFICLYQCYSPLDSDSN